MTSQHLELAEAQRVEEQLALLLGELGRIVVPSSSCSSISSSRVSRSVWPSPLRRPASRRSRVSKPCRRDACASRLPRAVPSSDRLPGVLVAARRAAMSRRQDLGHTGRGPADRPGSRAPDPPCAPRRRRPGGRSPAGAGSRGPPDGGDGRPTGLPAAPGLAADRLERRARCRRAGPGPAAWRRAGGPAVVERRAPGRTGRWWRGPAPDSARSAAGSPDRRRAGR